MDAIYGIQNAAIEAGEAGITSFDQWRNALLAAGADTAYVDAFFQALNNRGLTSLDQIKEASTRVLGGVIADMGNLSPQLAEQWKTAQAEAVKYMEAISKIPDNGVKNITLNVRANLDAASQQILSSEGSVSSSANVTPFATGGIVTKPTLGLVGEAGPEAILPLSRMEGMLRAAGAMTSSTSSNIYNIDARGASAGVENTILKALKMVEQRAIESALTAVADSRDRGGNFSDSF